MLLSKLFGRSRLFNPYQYVLPWQGKVIVIAKLDSPTYQFYFASRQHLYKDYIALDYRDCHLNDKLALEIALGCQIVLVRDTPVEVIKQLLGYRPLLAGVSWFIDDDIPAIHIDRNLPRPYRARLAVWFFHARKLLAQLCSEVWVSTSYLAHKYQLPIANVISPLAVSYPQQEKVLPLVRCFYHGSSSHQSDWLFIVDVIKQVQLQNEHIWFELIGDHQLYKMCRGIPRVTVLHPMTWPDYLAYTDSRTMDIGLVPLVDTPFNLARSHTKLLDITRQHAVGIYGQRFSYAEQITTLDAGLIADDSVQSWVDCILLLANRSLSERNVMLNQAQLLLDTDKAHAYLPFSISLEQLKPQVTDPSF